MELIVSPMYCTLHNLHDIKYITFSVTHVKDILDFKIGLNLSFVILEKNVSQSFKQGQVLHLPKLQREIFDVAAIMLFDVVERKQYTRTLDLRKV